MVIIKTKTGVTYVNEKKTQIIQWNRDQQMVVIRSDPKELNCNISDVVTVHYITKSKKKKKESNKSKEL